MKWIKTIDNYNFLALYDVMLDIKTELNILSDNISIPLLQNIVKFPQLFRIDSPGTRDKYCGLRYKAIKFLKKNGIISEFKLIKGLHRWESKIEIELEKDIFEKSLNRIELEYKKRISKENNQMPRARNKYRHFTSGIGGISMEADKIIAELERYENAIEEIKSRFSKNRDDIHIKLEDDSLLHQYVKELIDFYNDLNIKNNYSGQIIDEFSEGISNYVRSPSYNCVENILSIIRASITRFKRNPELLNYKQSENKSQSQIQRDNIFIIHGRDEAKWRELHSILKNEFHLNPIILEDQPDIGCNTIIEKFENYAQKCSYAIAVFTPDDDVKFENKEYLQARPNVIYEVGWFCGKLDRSKVMLLLKDGTSIFSNFDGIIQKRFINNISEKTTEIKRDLMNSGIINQE